jgi:hypothetical protein
MSVLDSWRDAIDSVNDRFVPGRPESGRQIDAESAIGALPERAREKLIDLRQRAADLRASIEAAMDQRDQAMTRVHELDSAVRRLLAPFSREGFQQPENSQEVTRARGQLVGAQERRDRAVAHIAKLNAQWTPLHNLVERLNAFVHGGGIKQPFTGRVAPPASGESASASVAKARDKITKLRADIAACESAPLPVGEARARGHAQVAALARQGQPRIGALFQRDKFASIEWPSGNERLQMFGDVGQIDGAVRRVVGFAAGDVEKGVALMAWLFEDALQARVADLIKQSADEKNALTAEQQRQRREALTAELLLVERAECVAIEASEEAGTPIAYRTDCSAAAVLRVIA